MNLVNDESGTLAVDKFFCFQVPFDELNPLVRVGENLDRLVVAKRRPSNEELLLAEGDGWLWAQSNALDWEKPRVARKCAADPAHQTQIDFDRFELTLYGGPRCSWLVPDSGLSVLVNADCAKDLSRSGFFGFELKKATILHNFSNSKLPELYHVYFRGANCFRPQRLVKTPNACPFCLKGPVYCSSCGFRESVCRNCEKPMWVAVGADGGPSDKRLRIKQSGDVLDGKRWDGTDFIRCFGSDYISKRVLNWLLARHAAPFQAYPTQMCVDGMSESQLARLREVTEHK